MLRGQPEPVSLAAVAHALDRHPNTVREQLGALIEAGWARRVPGPIRGRGRPAWLYSAVGTATRGWTAAGARAAALVRLLGADRSMDPIDEGRRWAEVVLAGRVRHAARDAEPWDTMVEVLDELGYEPEVAREADRVVLHRCPLLQAAHERTEVACTLHIGLVEGLLDGLGDAGTPISIVPFSGPSECELSWGPAAPGAR